MAKDNEFWDNFNLYESLMKALEEALEITKKMGENEIEDNKNEK
jgi:hypothetical protein